MWEDPTLAQLGWDDGWAEAAREPLVRAGEAAAAAGLGDPVCARVVRVDRGFSTVAGEHLWARATSEPTLTPPEIFADPPVTGDWLVVAPLDAGRHVVLDRLARRTVVSRRDPAERLTAQVLVANVDVAAVVVATDQRPSRRKVERALVIATDGGAAPAVIITKADLDPAVGDLARDLAGAAPDLRVVVTSVTRSRGLEEVVGLVERGGTLALIGASGAGKSTLVNALVGARLLETAEVRPDGRGRHTTVRRELVPVPGGRLVIDTPGLRGLGLWEAHRGLARVFADIVELAGGCRFGDCAHRDEPGCAVRAAVADGRLDPGRLEHYLELVDEIAEVAARRTEQRRRRGEGGRR